MVVYDARIEDASGDGLARWTARARLNWPRPRERRGVREWASAQVKKRESRNREKKRWARNGPKRRGQLGNSWMDFLGI